MGYFAPEREGICFVTTVGALRAIKPRSVAIINIEYGVDWSGPNPSGQIFQDRIEYESICKVSRDLVNTSGTVQDHISYSVYGRVTGETSSLDGDRFKFTGREYDSEVSSWYFRARHYDPSSGRFMSEDPKSFAAGDENIFRYCLNQPSGIVDPTGLEPTRNTAMPLNQLLEFVENLENTYPGESPEETLERLRDAIKGTQGSTGSGMGSPSGSNTSASESGSTSNSSGTGNIFPWGYVYTEDVGWIDLGHFSEAAHWANGAPDWAVSAYGYLVEGAPSLVGIAYHTPRTWIQCVYPRRHSVEQCWNRVRGLRWMTGHCRRNSKSTLRVRVLRIHGSLPIIKPYRLMKRNMRRIGEQQGKIG